MAARAIASRHGDAELRGWITGFVDGEGCFAITFQRMRCRDRARPWLGYSISPSFVVTQGLRSIGCLEFLRDYFDAGAVTINQRLEKRREGLGVYGVYQLRELVDTIVPFFTNNALQTSKYLDFIRVSQCLNLIEAGEHATLDGYLRVLSLAESMNGCETRGPVRKFMALHGAAK